MTFEKSASSLRADVSPRNCCKIARIDRISSLFNDDIVGYGCKNSIK
ncbi:hypothetical protein [Rickettsia endosymbiont of Culicoides newsteadi]|nr:hypothetical protein [Rickettsia endosymbiont of Culicoides newsteadi]